MSNLQNLLPLYKKASKVEVGHRRTTLSEDNYYYSDNGFLPLPIYRVKFGDPESTWYHINVANGEILSRITNANRLERWIFKGLHSLDF